MPTAPFNPVPNFDFMVVMWEVQGPDLIPGLGDVATGITSALVSIGTQALFGGFAEIQGLDTRLEIEDYWEGGNNLAPRRFVKHGAYPDLVMKRGVGFDTSLVDWHIQAKLTANVRIRKDGIILLMDRGGPADVAVGIPFVDRIPVAGWWFRNALPKEIRGPNLSAKGNEIAVEQLVLSHEGLDRLSPALIPGFTDMAAGLGGLGSLATSAALGSTGALANV